MKNSKSNKDNANLILNYFILISTLILIIVIIVNSIKTTEKISEEDIKIEYEALSKAYSDSEGIYLNIKLNEITTSDTDFKNMKDNCDSYILNSNTDDSEKVQTDIKVNNNEVYIDKVVLNDNSNLFSEQSNKELTSNNETGPIYFQDKMILRYINNNGDFKIIAANKEEVFNKNNIKNAFSEYVNSIEKSKTETLYEEQYLQEVVDIFTNIINSGMNKIDKNTKKKAVRYLTYDGYKYIVVNNMYKLDKLNNAKVVIAEIGKSSLENNKKDRIFIRLEADNNRQVNLVLKLDTNYKIFDIDIL